MLQLAVLVLLVALGLLTLRALHRAVVVDDALPTAHSWAACGGENRPFRALRDFVDLIKRPD